MHFYTIIVGCSNINFIYVFVFRVEYYRDDKKLNNMLERSFYMRLQTINDRSFDVDNSNTLLGDMKQPVVKLNGQEIGQCYVKRIDDTRLILTVAPSYEKEEFNSLDNSSEDSNIQPINRSRASTWHHNKRTFDQPSSSLCLLSQDDSMLCHRTISMGSKPQMNTDVSSWTHLGLDRSTHTSVNTSQTKLVTDVKINNQTSPRTIYIEFYDCRQEDVENVLMSDNHLFDHTIIDDYTDDSSSSSNISSNSSGQEEEKEEKKEEEKKEEENGDSQKEIVLDQPGTKTYRIVFKMQLKFYEKRLIFFLENQSFLTDFLHDVNLVFNQSFVTTVFRALYLGMDVQHVDVQRAVDNCQNRLISFDITDYLKVRIIIIGTKYLLFCK